MNSTFSANAKSNKHSPKRSDFFTAKWMFLLVLIFSSLLNYGQVLQTYTIPGNVSWQCPAGVTSITVECWGGGGAGGGSVTVLAPGAGAGGGGGGYTKETTVSVIPGQSYNVTVGKGGSGNVDLTVNGNNGGDSFFGTSSSSSVAHGGIGGGGNGGAPGIGGIGANWSGGDGAAAANNNTTSGGGGGGAGSGSNGGNANQTTPGSGGTGNSSGNGGGGLTTNANGKSGNSIGGGGSGAGPSGLFQTWTGGSGADGEVIITNTTPAITAISSDICAGGSITISGANFLGITAANVTIGGTVVSSITSYTSTQIIAVVNIACAGNVKVTTVNGTATSSGTFTSKAIPAAPTVTSPINYCLNTTASQLTATGSNLTWGSGTVSGSAGGSTVLSAFTFLSNTGSNKKTDFTTTSANVKITTVDYYIPANQPVSGLQLALFNSSGGIIAISGTITTKSSGSTAVIISNTFNYTIAVAGNYSIGVYAGTGTVGGDSTATFPITEPSGTIIVTGVEAPVIAAKPYHCFNNIGFVVDNASSIAPTPATSVVGSTNYLVSQTVNGCVSPQATIALIVNSLSVGGSVSSSATVCSGTNSGTVNLTGQTGSVLKWQYSTDGGTSWTDIVNTTTSQTYTNLTQTTWGRAVVQNGVCASVNSNPVTITAESTGSWAGSVSNDWNDSRNWICGLVPTSANNVTIQSGASNYPLISSGNAYAHNITIQSGGSLTIAGGDLQIFGAITNNSGTFDATAGTIEMKGASAQTIDGSAFYKNTINNLIVSNTGAGLWVSSSPNDTLKITGSLTFGNSASTLNTGDNITLVSNSAATASVGIVAPSNTINGSVIVERYINIGTAAGQHPKSWEFLATPTMGQTVKQSWMEDANTPVPSGYGTQITGAGGIPAGFDTYTPSPSLKYYNPASDAWVGVTNTNNSIYMASGYMVFVRGDRTITSVSQAANTTTLRTKGALLTGTLAPISVIADKYASIGNPYASPVDFTTITKGAAIDNQFYVWDPYLYGSYGVGGYQTLSSANEWKPVPGGTSAYPSGTPYYTLQSGQAIFVHATSNPSYSAPDYTLTFEESDKSNSSSTNVSRMSGGVPATSRAFFGVSLYTANLIADGNTVAFDRSYSDNVDGNDALKMTNGGENFGLKRNGKLLAIEARAPVALSDTLYYYMTNLQQKTYQLRFAPVNMATSGLQAYLVDNFLSTSTPVSLSDSSFINITVTSNAASSASGRFEVVFRTLSVTPVTFTSITAVQKNADIALDWKVENESGIRQYEVEESPDGSLFTQVATVAPQNNGSASYRWLDVNVVPGYHYYRVGSVGKDGQIQYTQIVKVLIGKMDAFISVYPNPIVNENIHLDFNNEPEGNYIVRLLNSLGQLIVLKVISHGAGTSTEEIIPGQTLAKGIYQLEVTKPGGNVEVVKVVN